MIVKNKIHCKKWYEGSPKKMSKAKMAEENQISISETDNLGKKL